MKNVYLIIKDPNQPNAKLELYETLKNGLYSKYMDDHYVMDAGEFFIENITDVHTLKNVKLLKKLLKSL